MTNVSIVPLCSPFSNTSLSQNNIVKLDTTLSLISCVCVGVMMLQQYICVVLLLLTTRCCQLVSNDSAVLLQMALKSHQKTWRKIQLSGQHMVV